MVLRLISPIAWNGVRSFNVWFLSNHPKLVVDGWPELQQLQLVKGFEILL